MGTPEKLAEKNNKPIQAEATGNTFLIFDYLDKYEHDFDESVVRYYHRLYGFEKFDGCLVLTKVNNEDSAQGQLRESGSALLMRVYVYEPGDGFCGNGSRAVAKYCFHHYRNLYSQFFIVLDGQLHELLQRDTEYFVDMGKPVYYDTGTFVKKGVLDGEGKLIAGNITWQYVNTSEPHLVTFDQIDDERLVSLGNSLNQETDRFPGGINLNRVLLVDKSTIDVLTFERGNYRLTKSCGSGSTSCVVLAKRLGLVDKDASKITVKVRGGRVVVSNENDKVYLSGPCLVEGIDDIYDKNQLKTPNDKKHYVSELFHEQTNQNLMT